MWKNSLDVSQANRRSKKDKGTEFQGQMDNISWSNMCVIQVLEREEGKDEAGGETYN